MILTPFNSTNPYLWGREIKFVINGHVVDNLQQPTELMPNEFDFFNHYCSKDPINARQYYNING